MLVSSRQVYKVNRKIKRENAPIEVYKKEEKISKPTNYHNHYDRDENDQEEFEMKWRE